MLITALNSLLCSAQERDDNVRRKGAPKGQGSSLNLNQMQGQLTKLKNVSIKSNTTNIMPNSHLVQFGGFVRLLGDNGSQIFADKAVANLKTEVITLTGRVQVYQSAILYFGDRVTYDYGKNKLNTKGMKVSLDPFILEADEITTTEFRGKPVYIGKNAGITTHDVQDPNFWMRANTITIYPDNRVTFKNLKFYAGDVPVFWLPYLSQSLDKDLGYHFLPGGRSNWGPFLMNRYGMMLGGEENTLTGAKEDAWLLGKFHFDLRALRGVGNGIDLHDTRLKNNQNLGWLKLYYANDLDPSRPRSGFQRGFVNEDRYRAEFKYRFKKDSLTTNGFYADANITWLSDRYYLEDFEPRTYTYNPEPDNTLGVFHRSDRALAGVYTRLKLNDFHQTDSRLPELFYERVALPIKRTNIQYQSSSSFGVYREDLADFRRSDLYLERASLLAGDPRIAQIDSLLAKRDFVRFHTYHNFSQSFTPADGITITPRAGLGYTRYWNEGSADNNFSKTTFHAGVDTSLKFSKVYNFSNKKWGVDRIKHVSEPYANLSFVSTNELDSSFSKIDRLTPTTRPRSIDVGSFNAIDGLNNWSIARLGVRNQLVTRRDGGTHQWLTMDTYIDYFMQDPELQRNFSNLYNDIYWQPLPWMEVSLETQFPIVGTGSGFTEVATGLRFMPNENWELSLNYRFLDNHPVLQDSSRFDIRAYTRINEKWGLDIYQQFELDDNTLETQQYTVHRDFDSWITSLGVLRRDNRTRKEYSVLLSFTLKEFPSINIPLTIDQKEN